MTEASAAESRVVLSARDLELVKSVSTPEQRHALERLLDTRLKIELAQIARARESARLEFGAAQLRAYANEEPDRDFTDRTQARALVVELGRLCGLMTTAGTVAMVVAAVTPSVIASWLAAGGGVTTFCLAAAVRLSSRPAPREDLARLLRAAGDRDALESSDPR